MEIIAQKLGPHGAVVKYIGKSGGTHFVIDLETGQGVISQVASVAQALDGPAQLVREPPLGDVPADGLGEVHRREALGAALADDRVGEPEGPGQLERADVIGCHAGSCCRTVPGSPG